MIERIEFKNYKALRSAVLPLGRFTLIVGPNGSGKTTALRALTSILTPANFPHALLATAGSAEDVSVSVNWGEPYAGLITKANWSRVNATSLEWLDPEGRPIIDGRMAPLQRLLQKYRIYTLDSEEIAKPVTLNPTIELADTGTGLAVVLDQLRDRSSDRWKALNAELPRWFGEYDQIVFDTPSEGKRAFALRTRAGERIPAEQCSQGTLLALTILTLAHLPDPPPVIGFEEPDRGIHPRLLREVQDALYRLAYPEGGAESRAPIQVIATTHSPYLLDLFKDHPEEIVIAQRNGADANFERLSDHPHLDQILDGASLGEVWFTGILGGVPVAP